MVQHNLLSPNKYKVVIERFPTVDMFTQRVPLPSVTLGSSMYYTNQDTDIKLPGDKIEYEDLIISLLVDKDLNGIIEILKWIQSAATSDNHMDMLSQISIQTLTNNSNANRKITFYNCFPQTMSNILFDVSETEDNPPSIDAIFKYSHYTIT